ncbi:PilZ domain-containing protein [Rummeliibacillus sp. TYF005]|uniref:PilZ domain-containing protein n=1 Tax=unclassified Rummeliibacillus TaxID=2622809 RepID=UPI000E6728A0|nr:MULTISPECIES: PilZ domain-containing protein [unclassified Rummeliibacillus]RIJ65063.1 PilZ domain-containing protein [Rummeliibacillus sp. POC4]RPJ96839.1 PilZ domain-containing protein [Rummeliibacillus sp. TYF005]
MDWLEYRRKEYFRHVLIHEVPVTYSFKRDGMMIFRKGQIIDISPSGLKMFTEVDLSSNSEMYDLDLSFILFSKSINVKGDIRWKKAFGDGYYYGIDMNNVEQHQELIISELKLRRKKEVFEEKRQNL